MASRLLFLTLSAITLTAALISPSLQADNSPEPSDSEKKATQTPSVKLDALLMLDGSVFDGVYSDGDSQTDAQIRRLNVGMSAELAKTVELEISAKLDDDKIELKDALLSWEFSAKQTLIFGKQKEPVGLENNQSSKQIASMERSMASSIFSPDRNIGLAYSYEQSDHTIALGIFEADSDSDDAGLAFSTRATAALIKNKVQTVHIGGSFSHRDLGGSSLKLNDEGGVDAAENIVSSSRFDVDTMQTVGLEFVWLRGPLTVQAEAFQSNMQLSADENARDPSYYGSYLQGSWLFGQVRRKYKNGSLKLSGLKGASAWEAVLRAETADLDDDEGGSQANVVMLGVNHYRGKHIRIMASLLNAKTNEEDALYSEGNAATVRFQYAF